jgi:integrase
MKLRRVAQNLFKHGDVYYAQWHQGGKKCQRSLRTANRTIAGQKLRELLDTLPRVSTDRADFTLRQFAALWETNILPTLDLKPLSVEYRQQTIAAILRDLPANVPVRSLTLADLEAWKAARIRQASPQRFNNELGSLRMLFDYAMREKVVPANLARQLARVRIPQTRLVIPTRDQFAALIPLMRKLWIDSANLAELLAYSGMRQHEAASLLWRDVDQQRGQFHVTGGARGTKNRQTRWVPLFPAMKELLERMPHREDHLPVSIVATCRGTLRTACDKLGFPLFNHHSLRHFFTSNAIENGVDYLTIANWLGHKDGGILVGKVYGHLRQAHSEQSAARMSFSAGGL